MHRAEARILFVVPRYHTNQLGWVKVLQDLGCSVDMLVNVIGPTEDHSGLVPVRLPESSITRILDLIFRKQETNCPNYVPDVQSLVAFFRSRRPNVVVIRPYGPLFWLIASICARTFGATVIWYRQRIEPGSEISLPATSWLLKAAFNRLLGAISSRTITPLWRPGTDVSLRTRKWALVPFIAPVQQVSPRQSRDVLTVMTVGKFIERKRFDLLLHALSKCTPTQGCKIRIVIVGEASTSAHHELLNGVRGLVARLGLEKISTLHVNIAPSSMSDFYRNADLFVLPAQNEPASVSVVEALSHGVPVICSDTCGTRCYIRDGVTGGVFKSGSVDALTALLEPLLSNPHRLAAMGAAAAEDAKSCFGLATFLNGFNRALEGSGHCIRGGDLASSSHAESGIELRNRLGLKI